MKQDIVDQLLDQWLSEHPEKDVSALGVIVRIQILGKQFKRRTAAALTRHGLKHWEYDVLSVLRRQGRPFELPATDIARASQLTTGAMTTRIDGLESRGLVSRRKSRSDGRSVPVRLTARGKKLIDLAIDTRLEDANEALNNMTSNQRARLASGLRQLMLDEDI